VLNLLIAWSKHNYSYYHSYNQDDASQKDILQERDKADLVRTQKDTPVPGTANAATTYLKELCTTGNYDSSKENDKEDGWKLVTRGCKPQVKQTVTIYTTNSFKPLSTNDDPKTNKTMQQTTPVQQLEAEKDTKKRQQEKIQK
jgi:hypothetical protein